MSTLWLWILQRTLVLYWIHNFIWTLKSIAYADHLKCTYTSLAKSNHFLRLRQYLLSLTPWSRLDTFNSLLSGCYHYLLKRLQMVHNCAARLILGRRKYEHVTPMLVELHWLPVKERIVYKICLFVFKCLNHSAPQYLQDLVIPYKKERSLRRRTRT